MIPFHSVLPELAQREVRCIHLEAAPGVTPDSGLSAGECRLFREELARKKSMP
jgi:hypothetical protein